MIDQLPYSLGLWKNCLYSGPALGTLKSLNYFDLYCTYTLTPFQNPIDYLQHPRTYYYYYTPSVSFLFMTYVLDYWTRERDWFSFWI